MKHDEKKIEEIIREHHVDMWAQRLVEDGIKNLMREYAEHIVQQERERIMNGVLSERFIYFKGDENTDFAIKGKPVNKAIGNIINLIKQEDE